MAGQTTQATLLSRLRLHNSEIMSPELSVHTEILYEHLAPFYNRLELVKAPFPSLIVKPLAFPCVSECTLILNFVVVVHVVYLALHKLFRCLVRNSYVFVRLCVSRNNKVSFSLCGVLREQINFCFFILLKS